MAPDFFRGFAFVHGDKYQPWLDAHHPVKEFEDTKAIVDALKSMNITKIRGVGFCWGGKVVVELLMRPLIETRVLIHPTSITDTYI